MSLRRVDGDPAEKAADACVDRRKRLKAVAIVINDYPRRDSCHVVSAGLVRTAAGTAAVTLRRVRFTHNIY